MTNIDYTNTHACATLVNVYCMCQGQCVFSCLLKRSMSASGWWEDSGPELLPSEERWQSQGHSRGQSSSEQSGSLVRWALPLTAGELLSEHAAGTVLACTLTTAPPRRQGSHCVTLTHCSLCPWALLHTASVSLWNLRNPSAHIKSSYNPG